MSELSKLLGCFGYNGFGSGYAVAKFGQPDDTQLLACGRCDRAAACWDRHRERVRGLLPAMTEIADAIAASGVTGEDYIKEFQRQIGEKDPHQIVEPYLLVMMGNMEDGNYVAGTGKPVHRKETSLTWPLKPLE